jgi:hypothetical protein
MSSLDNVLSTMRSAKDYQAEQDAAYARKKAEDEAAYQEEWRPDLGQILAGAALTAAGPFTAGATVPAGIGMMGGGLMNKKAVNRRGGAVQGPKDDTLTQLLMKLQSQQGEMPNPSSSVGGW